MSDKQEICNKINETCYKICPELKEKIGGWVEKNNGEYEWVKGPGDWVEKNDGSGHYKWVPKKIS